MKRTSLTLSILLLFVASTTIDAARKIKDWETSATLFCGLQEEEEVTRISRADGEHWIKNNSIPENCILMEKCGTEQNAICGSCYKDEEHNLKIDDINDLRTYSGDRHWKEYEAIKIQESKKHDFFRILNFRSRNLLEFKDWEFYPTTQNKMTLYSYSWKTKGMFKTDITHTLNRESLLLKEEEWFTNNWKNYNRTYKCRVIPEKELDESIEGFKKFQSSYYEELRKKDLEKSLKEQKEQEKKNKI